MVDASLHVISESDLALLVTNDRETQIASRDLVDVLNPSSMALDGVGTETNELYTTLGEFWLEFCESTKLGCADRSVVFWVGEEDNPVVADELVEINWAGRGLGLEVWRNAAEAERVRRHYGWAVRRIEGLVTLLQDIQQVVWVVEEGVDSELKMRRVFIEHDKKLARQCAPRRRLCHLLADHAIR